MSDAPPPRWPHLIGKGILYQSELMSKHMQLVQDLWALVDRLSNECLEGEDVLDPRGELADEIALLLVKAGETRERTQK